MTRQQEGGYAEMELTLILAGVALLACALHALFRPSQPEEWPTTTKEGDSR